MVVYGPRTREAALQMMRENGKVCYSDQYLYSVVVETPEKLDNLIQHAFDRDDIVIVARDKSLMEYYTPERKRVKNLQRVQNRKSMQEWMRRHPREVAKVLARN